MTLPDVTDIDLKLQAKRDSKVVSFGLFRNFQDLFVSLQPGLYFIKDKNMFKSDIGTIILIDRKSD